MLQRPRRSLSPTAMLVVLAAIGCTPKPAPDPIAPETASDGPSSGQIHEPHEPDVPYEPEPPPSEDPPRVPSRTFTRGERAPVGLTEPEIADYNAAQGDPHVGHFELAHAFAGDATLAESRRGPLVAIVRTTLGDFECILFEDEVPRTVANFVGLKIGSSSRHLSGQVRLTVILPAPRSMSPH